MKSITFSIYRYNYQEVCNPTVLISSQMHYGFNSSVVTLTLGMYKKVKFLQSNMSKNEEDGLFCMFNIKNNASVLVIRL